MGKRILILTAEMDAGAHGAAAAIAEALEPYQAQGYTVAVADPLSGPDTPDFLRAQLLDEERLLSLAKAGGPNVKPTAQLAHALAVALYEALANTLDPAWPDVIINTHPFYPPALAAVFSVRRAAAPLITVVTDLAEPKEIWFHPANDYVLVANESVSALAQGAGLAAHQVKATGLPVTPRLGEPGKSREKLRAELGWLPARPAALVVGGARTHKLREVLRAINHSRLPLQLALLAGGDERLLRTFTETEWHLPAYIYAEADDLTELLHAADLLIGQAGGPVSAQALACGLPLLLTDALPGEQQAVAAYVTAGGAGELVESPLHALETLFHWLDADGALLKERAASARAWGKPEAANDAAILAVQLAAQGPTEPKHELLGRARLLRMLRAAGVQVE